jgi:hypothetical protein
MNNLPTVFSQTHLNLPVEQLVLHHNIPITYREAELPRFKTAAAVPSAASGDPRQHPEAAPTA